MVTAHAINARKFQRLWETTLAEEPSVIDYRLGQIEKGIDRMAGAFERLTVIEERHHETRASLERIAGGFTTQISDHEARLRKIETEMPTNILTSKWTIAGLLGIAAIVGVAVIRIVMVTTSFGLSS